MDAAAVRRDGVRIWMFGAYASVGSARDAPLIVKAVRGTEPAGSGNPLAIR